MAQLIWTSTLFTTNARESAHANINRNGCNLSLLAAITKAKEFDKLQWSSAYTYKKANVPESYRDKSPLQRTIKSVKKTITSESINIEEQERILRIENKKLAIQKNKNDELEKEIML
ncbi:17412_t:CDS:2 [Dentiscutata heterogama]|uniref:17412_t:CDS:1 n=1 Tax=Dentiscutata heterogama TaxID=1316150 RepID=A0ACA9LU93_9GLOM|nr:17412_t:CDS:2 [Dentiscutata heterogama]